MGYRQGPAPWGIFKAYLLVADAVTVKVPDTSIVPVLYNPPTSGVVFQILRVHWGVTGGTIIVAAEEYALANGVTHSSTTDGPAPINMAYGHGTQFLGNWYKVTTMSAASTTILPYGGNSGGASAAGARSNERYDEGRIYLYPGGTFIPVTASARSRRPSSRWSSFSRCLFRRSHPPCLSKGVGAWQSRTAESTPHTRSFSTRTGTRISATTRRSSRRRAHSRTRTVHDHVLRARCHGRPVQMGAVDRATALGGTTGTQKAARHPDERHDHLGELRCGGRDGSLDPHDGAGDHRRQPACFSMGSTGILALNPLSPFPTVPTNSTLDADYLNLFGIFCDTTRSATIHEVRRRCLHPVLMPFHGSWRTASTRWTTSTCPPCSCPFRPSQHGIVYRVLPRCQRVRHWNHRGGGPSRCPCPARQSTLTLRQHAARGSEWERKRCSPASTRSSRRATSAPTSSTTA